MRHCRVTVVTAPLVVCSETPSVDCCDFECHCYVETLLIFSVVLQFCYFCWSVLFTFWFLLSPCLTPECGDYRHSLLCPAHFSFIKYWTKLSRKLSGFLLDASPQTPPPFFPPVLCSLCTRGETKQKRRVPAWVKASTDQFCYMAVFWDLNVKVLSVNVMKFWCPTKDMFKTRFLCRHL